MSLVSSIIYSNIISLLILSAIIYVKWDLVRLRLLTFLRDKIGLDSFDKFQVTFDSRKRLTIYLSGVKLHKVKHQKTADSPIKLWINRLVSSNAFKTVMEFILNVPVHLIMATLANYVTLHVDHLSFQLDNIVLQVEHIKIESELTNKNTTNRLFQEKIFTIQTQIGPTTFKLAEKSFIDMTTICLISISCHFRARRLLLKDLDLDVQFGKTTFDINTCIDLVRSLKQTTHPTGNNSTSMIRLEDILNTINFKIQSIHFNYVINKEIVTNFDVCNIALFFSSADGQPTCQLNTDTISYFLAHHRLLLIPKMEINISLPEEDPTDNILDKLPSTDLVSIVWIIDTPVLQLPFQSKIVQETLRHVHASLPVKPLTTSQQVSTDQQTPQKVISDLPMYHLAIVLKSPKFILTEVAGLHGYMSSQNLIIRLSGEYVLKDRNSNYDDVSSSSSSSSSSHLDTLFAREEYKWLSASPGQKRHSVHETRTDPPITNRRVTLRHLMGRRQKIDPMQKKWNYKLSMKMIIQRASLGYEKDDERSEEFIRIKNAVIIAKSNMNVRQNDIVFALGSTIHSEAAIDKPMICLCQQDTALSASVFWLKSIPQALRNQYLCIFETPVKKTQGMSPEMQLLIKSLSCSLDVTEGSIVAWSVDNKHRKKVQVPSGFIDNTPSENIYSRIILDTQKFTFVYQGTELILDQSQWKTRCHLEKLYIHQASTSVQDTNGVKELLEKDEKQHLILWISQLNFGTTYSQQLVNNQKSNLLDLTTKAKKIGVSYSIRNHYALLLFIRSLISLKETLKGDQVSTLQVTTAEPTIMNFVVDASIGRADIQVGLPFDEKIHLRLDEFKYQNGVTQPSKPHTQFRNIMLLGTSPLHKNKWEQLVELDQVQILADINPVLADSQIDLKARKIFATVPYKFVLAAVLDSIIGLVKAIKELHGRILNNDPHFTHFGPTIKNEPIVIPNIKLRTKLFSIHFDDDPFEAKLRNILRTGLAEQQRRIAYENALDDKVSDMLYAESSSFSIRSQPQEESLDQEPSAEDASPDSINANTISIENTEQIVEAQKSLLEYFSEFWIRHINKTKKEESQFYSDLYTREHYRNSETAANIDKSLDDGDSRRHDRFIYSKTFIIDIIPRPTHPPLVGFSAQFARVSFKRADFSVNETKNFIHHTGGGVPLGNDFSIIIPFHLSIKAGKTWIKVRDYPLPLLYVPPPVEQSKTSWILEGNYVAADELGNSGGSRVIPITIIPRKSETAQGYCLSAVRTTSPLKFYSVIDYQVLSPDMSMICWSISYSPAVQDILRVLDTLTAAQVDPSPKIGFWDKVRFIIHSKVKIDFTGGGDLALVVKGTRDPYQLKGRGAGLAKVWSNNVVWLLGHNNPQKEFMQIVSDDYAFGVPDLIRGGFVPDFPDSLCHKYERIGHHRFSKVALKLTDGIRMGIGLGFERLSCNDSGMIEGDLCFNCKTQCPHVIDRCRSQVFLPHYEVLFQSVEQVQNYHDPETYDAFRGFRSDFAHLSLSVVKLENSPSNKESPDYSKDDPYFDLTSQNSMHISPCFLEHSVDWYRMFGGPLTLPIRQGKLFPTEELKARSFGEILDTIKFKVVIDPLAIGMFFTDLETYLNIKGGGSVGLKARVSSFSVDLHQRREVTRSIADGSLQNKTDINLHEAEVQLTDIDLRVVKAVHYKNTDQGDQRAPNRSTTTKTYSKSFSESTSIPISDYATSSFSAEDDNSSFKWIDSKDFVILDSVTRQLPHYTKTEVFPFAYSPLFHYVKQTDEVDTEKRQYLRQTHDCIFGKGIESQEFQRAYMDRRANELSKVIDDHDKQLDIILHAIETYRNSPKELKAEYDILLKKIEYLQRRRYMLHAYLAELILEKELNRGSPNDGDGDSPRTSSSSICRRDEISRWQILMGHFKSRYFIHYPQIILNSSVREALFYLKDIQSSRSVQHFNLSARCLKFLEELVQTAEKQKQWKPDVPEPSVVSSKRNSTCFNEVFDESSSPGDEDKDTTEALIEKLLSERLTNFVAYNEKEEHKSKKSTEPSTPTDHVFEGIHVLENSKNFDDPDYQYQSIPDFYQMTSDYLIDLIHPQVVFQSNKGLDHLVLLTNERLHVKGFNIMDNNCTADTDMSLVKKRVVASFDNAQLLIAKKIEEIESYSSLAQNCYGQFQEKHWAVWTQPELLWSCQNSNFFENFQRVSSQLTGSMQIDLFNHLRIKINKYNNSRESPFEDRTNTTQLHLPQFKITLSSLQAHILYYTLTDLVLGSEGSPKTKLKLSKSKDVMLAAERSDLAETVEQVRVLQNRSRNLLNFYRQFKGEFAHLDLANKKEFIKNKRRMRESLENLYLIVEAIRSIQMFRRDIHLEETDDATRFIFTSDELVWEAMLDYSQNSSLCKCILNNTNYVLLKKPNGSSRNTVGIDRMQIKNTTASPVFDNVLDAYLDPSNPVMPDFSRYKMISGMLDTLPPVGGIPIIQHLEVNLLPLNLQISTLFFGLAMDYFFPQIVQSMENQHDLEEQYPDEDEHNLNEEFDDDASFNEFQNNNEPMEKTSLRSPPKREGSFISFDSITQKVKKSMSRKSKIKADELTVMKTRSSTNRTFIFVRIPSAKHCVSIQGPSRNTIYNIYNFMFKQPSLEYRNVTWTMAEMTEKIKREFKRGLFKQSPALLKKKLLANNKKNITNVTSSPQDFHVNREIVSHTVQEATEPFETPEIDLMDDSIVYNRHDTSEPSTSYNTEEDEDAYSNYLEDTKSLYSNAPEDEQERLIELQVASRNDIINVDNRLSSIYLRRYKHEDDNNELIEKGRILFGLRYNGPTN